MTWTLHHGDALDVLRGMPDASVDAVVTDPPAGIGFMGKEWDDFRRARNPADAGRNNVFGRTSARGPEYGRRDRQAFVDFLGAVLGECLRVLRPGGRSLVWSIPRTSHWTACAIEDAGFLIENVVGHLFGTGFPKGKSQLKPAVEWWWLARKPGGRVEPLQIDACRVEVPDRAAYEAKCASVLGLDSNRNGNDYGEWGGKREDSSHPAGRWPANVVLSHAPDCDDGCAAGCPVAAIGEPARFFYAAKASATDRGEGNGHPTVKSQALMRWLVRLITPPGGTVLDPFAGSGSTGVAALAEGMHFVGIEREAEYVEIARARLEEAARPAVQPDLFARSGH